MAAITHLPGHLESGMWGPYPTMWSDVAAPDGDALPFIAEPPGSVYIHRDLTNAKQRRYIKLKNNGTDDDWSSIIHCVCVTVARSAFTDGGSTSGTYALGETIPEGAYVLKSLLQNVTGFTGDTSAVIIVGDGTDTDRYNTGTPSVFTTDTSVDLGVPSGTAYHDAAKTVTITITSNADFTNVTAGQLTLKIFYLL